MDKAFTKFLDQIAPGDTVIAIRVTSVAHSAADFLNLLERIQNKGAYFKSLAEP
ncbi:MAG: recombinase family protein [Rhizobiales bacterium]|nr:recombinase family protein [Hyphomicrobiales bacterium]